jgi:hypothetical protein
MASHDAPRQPSAEEARALLAVLDIQPPPDFAVQVLARVYALQAARASAPVPYTRSHAEPPPSRGIRGAAWPGWPRSRLLGLSLVTGGLLVTSAALLWCVSIRTLPAGAPAGAWSASMTVQEHVVSEEAPRDGASGSPTSPQEVAAAVEPGRQPILLAPSAVRPTGVKAIWHARERPRRFRRPLRLRLCPSGAVRHHSFPLRPSGQDGSGAYAARRNARARACGSVDICQPEAWALPALCPAPRGLVAQSAAPAPPSMSAEPEPPQS